MPKKTTKKPSFKKGKATPADADIILKLYDLRREATMREARDYIGLVFWPQSFEEIMAVATAAGTDANRFFRQVLGYWETAASLVVHGAVNADLFNACEGEMYFVYAKFRPYIERVRKEIGQPTFLQNVQAVAEADPERMKGIAGRVAMLGEKMRKAAAAGR